MFKSNLLIVSSLALALSACTAGMSQAGNSIYSTPADRNDMPAPIPAPSYEADAVGEIINRQGDVIGSATFYEATNGVLMRLSVANLPSGPHGMHFHALGTCDDPNDGFKATGGHIMPEGKPHGYRNAGGPHAGNLPNLIVGEDGRTTVELYTNLVTMFDGDAALLDADGSTLIIHENQDDHITQPIGGAGGRIGCALIKAAR